MEMLFKVIGIEEIIQRDCGKIRDRGLGESLEEFLYLEM